MSVATADTTLPPSEPREVQGQRYQCFDIEGFKDLLKLESDAQACVVECHLVEKKANQLQIQVDALKNVSILQKASIRDLKVENDRVFKWGTDQNKLRHEAENEPRMGSWLGWGAAGVATALLAGFVIKDQLD